MKQETLVRNPFMMMLQPELVLAAMESSEKLGRLNRRQCHPLDRPTPLAVDDSTVRDDAVDALDD